jgi:peptidoglycan/xylan/chitin deacetylase (PgdA/CDA1 family)
MRMSARGKLYFIFAGLAGAAVAIAFAAQAQPAALTSALALRQGEVRQVERSFQFTVHTAGPVELAALDPQPDPEDGAARYICLEMRQDSSEDGTDGYGERICLGPAESGVGVKPFGGPPADVAEDETLEATVEQPGSGQVTVTIPLSELGLPAADYSFRFLSSDGSCGSKADGRCVDSLPEDDAGSFEIRTPVMASCRSTEGIQLRYGPRNEKKVALTFDDGPSVSTPEILEILDQKRADGTFFMLGEAVERNPEMTRQIVLQGSEVANHSMKHDSFPTSADLSQTNDVVEEASGVRPCSFRPPYGNVDAPLTGRASKEGMNTVLWDVDTEDWTDGSSVESVVGGTMANTQPGSIILMHDGGDSRRDKTIDSLPLIIDGLRARGYSFVTVAELLGNEIEWTIPDPEDGS